MVRSNIISQYIPFHVVMSGRLNDWSEGMTLDFLTDRFRDSLS